MPIVAREKGSGTKFPLAPEGGPFRAVCADVWPVWTEEKPAQYRKPGEGVVLLDKTRIVWLLDEIDPETGKVYEVSQIYTLSLGEKAKLREHLEMWRGRAFTTEERKGFDIEKLIGANCQLLTLHNTKPDGRVYCNVKAIMPPPKGVQPLVVPAWFVRKQDRDRVPAQSNGGAPFETTADDIPF